MSHPFHPPRPADVAEPHQFNRPRPGDGAQFEQVEHPSEVHWQNLIPGTAGPYLRVSEGIYFTATDVIALIASAGWTHPAEGDRLRDEVAGLVKLRADDAERIAELEAEVEHLRSADTRTALLDEMAEALATAERCKRELAKTAREPVAA